MTEPPMPPDVAEYLNEHRDGWVRHNGLTFLRATPDEVTAELTVEPAHLQGYGIVHGGVHCGIVETLASVGAALWAWPQGLSVVGLENSTSFLRAVRKGKLTGTARPLARGRSTQVWEVEIRDDRDRRVATGRVRLLCLDPARQVAGEPTRVEREERS
jgi:1,4-dihydroxy-2-naphthoyl-CoA hydrolase